MPPDLRGAPAILITNLQYLALQRLLAAARRPMRPPRLIAQLGGAASAVTPQPLVPRLAAEAILPATRRQAPFEHQHFLHEIQPQLRHRAHFPWHGSVLQ